MTGAEFSGVDIDLLADYVGGALDGTPDEAAVTALIAEDDAWREAHAALTEGVATVTADLRSFGAAPEPMPADVFARLDAALLAAGADPQAGAGPERTAPIGDVFRGATAGPAAMEPGSDGVAPARHLVAVPSASRSKRARRLRWAAPVGIAAGVLAFVGFGFQQQFAGGSSDEAASSTAGGAAEQSAPLAAAEPFSLPAGPVALSESGTDYRLGTLAQAGQQRTSLDPPLGQAQDGDFRKSVPSSAGKLSASSVELDRLRVQEAMRVCIEAIQSQHGAGEIKPQTIDFARFDGAPAVIVAFTTTDGGSWVWASGPACGAPGVGADKLASVKVG